MEFLHINPSTKNVHMFDKMVDDGKHVFVLIYMEGCGPCIQTRPEWKKIKNILGEPDQKIKYPGVVVADVDQTVTNNIKHISDISGFPTMRYISGKGKIVENYNNDRLIDSFIKWIDSKHSNFIDKTPNFSKSKRFAQGRRRYKPRKSRRTHRSTRTYKNAGWKWKPRNKYSKHK